MKRVAIILAAVMTVSAFGNAVSTKWEPAPHKHPHGVGLRCPLCGQTWDAIPHGLKAWEVRHLLKVRSYGYALHMRLRHSM